LASLDRETSNKLDEVSEVFSPSSPIQSRDFFFGRFAQLKKVEQAIREKGQHVVLFGERGVGKTSFSNIIEREIANTKTSKITLSRSLDFAAIWTELLRKARKHLSLPEKQVPADLDPQQLIDELEELKVPYLFIIDEFDSLPKDQMPLFADLVKALSDNLPQITIMFVGIGVSVSDLIGEHASLERCLRQIHLPRMSSEELVEIIDKGLLRLKMKMDNDVKADIVSFSHGFAHYTHLLAKYAVENAIEMRYPFIARNNFDNAIRMAIENAHESIRGAYHKAVVSRTGPSNYTPIVYACALVMEDESMSFRSSDIKVFVDKLTLGQTAIPRHGYYLGKLCQVERGTMLVKVPFGKQFRYRFKNPILKAYILLELYQKGLLKEFKRLRS
jgi:energy-coupling factor transporter ATP-binding protein EcfA2